MPKRIGVVLSISLPAFLFGLPAFSQCQWGPESCLQDYVWRDASPTDHVCVTPDRRTQANTDNAQAAARRSPNGGQWGPDSCLQGYVWREAFPGDHVCVLGDVRAQAAADNAQASARRNPVCTAAKELHLCVDQAAAGQLPPKASHTELEIQPDGSVLGVAKGPLAGVPDLMWDPGQILRVRMTGGSAFVRSKVRQFATEWTRYANINFAFVDDSQAAEIKVSFNPDGTSWSIVGRQALLVPFNFPTMNYGWFDDSTPDSEFSRVVLHEFGHALGLIHEHQSPVSGIQWNKEKVYAYFKAMTPPWDKGAVDEQVFNKYNASSTNFSQFDPTSIMEYFFPASLTLNGIGVPGNTQLSSMDKDYIARWYPRPGARTGQLRTDDDCDEIDFDVAYGVVAADKLRVKVASGANVTWWKSVSVPTNASGYNEIQVTGGSSNEQDIDRAIVDNSRPVRFSKAKFLGAHTMLGYSWDVLTALPGGTQLILTWSKDRCG